MKAVILKGTGDTSQLKIEEVQKPIPKADEILVKMESFSINPIEIKTRKGNRFSELLLKDKPSILGWDAAGIVEEVGANVKAFSKGNRVFGVIGFPEFGKTYAEYFIAKEKDLCRIPENVDFPEAAVSTIAGLTAYQALVYDAKLTQGSKVLVHAASGGVGHFGVQIAKNLGVKVYATASKEKHDFVKELGADVLIDYKTQKFEDVIDEKMDVVFDLIGGDYIDRSLKVLKPGGKIISIPSVSNGKVVEKAEADGKIGIRFIMKQDNKDLSAIAEMLGDGRLKPVVSEIYKMEDIGKAHQHMEQGHTKGKIAVRS